MERIEAKLMLSHIPSCSGPNCGKAVNSQAAIFLIRIGATIGFCGPKCYEAACRERLDVLRASTTMKQKGDVLVTLGFEPGKSVAIEGEGPPCEYPAKKGP